MSNKKTPKTVKETVPLTTSDLLREKVKEKGLKNFKEDMSTPRIIN